MDLNRNKWYVRWYFWSLGIVDEFCDRGDNSKHFEKAGTNLCAFMRMIMVYAPLILLFTAIVYAAGIASVTVLPIYFFGLKGYGIILGAIVVLVLGICLAMMVYNSLTKKRLAKEQMAKPADTDATNPSFFRVVWQWLVAKKQKVCPLVTFVQDKKEAQS